MSNVSRSILRGDKVRVKPSKAKVYGVSKDDVFTVERIDDIQGRRRLYVDRSPSMIWNGDAQLAWGAASKERMAALGL